MNANVRRILKGMKSFPSSALEFPSDYLTNPKAFSRNRVLNLNNLCFFMLGNTRCSLSVELDRFYSRLNEKPCTKSAFSKSRYRLKPLFFSDWSDRFSTLLYAKPEKLHRWKGFYLKGVDGSTLALFNTPELVEEFGVQSNQHKSIPMARVGLEFDLLNGFCTQAALQHFSLGENKFAIDFLAKSQGKSLHIYDRYFASFDLIYRHFVSKSAFLMRCKVDFNNTVRDFVQSGQNQAIVTFPITERALVTLNEDKYAVNEQTTVKVRLVRIDIGKPEPEILITSLLDEVVYPYDCFKKLYFMRWGIETQYDKLKNKFQLAAFTGHKPEAIYQDFYTTIITSNIQNLICTECRDGLKIINEGRKTPVNINQNVSIGLLKPRLMFLFIGNKMAAVFEELKRLFLSVVELIRPNRSYLRTKTVRLKGKYRTHKNYRRAY
jgi:Transposase DDE domain